MRETKNRRILKRLIRDIKGMELEAGRSLAFEELRTLRLDPHLIDSILRQVAEARSTDRLVATLQSFASQRQGSRLWRFLGRILQRT